MSFVSRFSSSLSLHSHGRRSPHHRRSASGARPHRLSFPADRRRFELRRRGSIGAWFAVRCSLRGRGSGAGRGGGFASARSRLRSAASFLPGGGWWSLRGDREGAGAADAEAVSVATALRWIWGLVAEDRLVIYVALGSLAVAALSEITMPSLLAASLFTAQSGCRDLFYRQVRLLGILCCTSGICSGLRSGCFAIANTILVKRLRETIFSSLLFQDIGFFDTKSVGDLTSRLGSDCQQLSHVIGSDMNLIIRNVLQVLAVLLGGLSILTGYVSPEQLTKYILYCEWMIYATWRLVDSLMSLLRSIGASEEVFHLMSLSPSHQYLSKGLKMRKLRGHIQFVNVSFQYPSRIMVPVLANVNFSIQPNEVVAIVGASGCGKTSLVSLLLRFYDPVDGQIYIDDFPIKELDIRCLRGKIGFVGQEPHLFHMDISSNVSYGCSRNINQEDVEWAARQAGAHDFISSLPDGYQTVVRDGLLSGGQKQRIAIARAILRDPAILILDEATSALDTESEQRIKDLIFNKTARTVIVIAHRLSTVENADRIIVMDGGRVVEVGRHKELLLRDGFYARLIKYWQDSIGF